MESVDLLNLLVCRVSEPENRFHFSWTRSNAMNADWHCADPELVGPDFRPDQRLTDIKARDIRA
jgi:hypothetical protein